MTSKTSKTSKTSGLLPALLQDEFGQAVLDWMQEALPLYAESSAKRCWREPPPFEWDRGASIRLQPAAPAVMLGRFKTTAKVRKQLFAFARRLLGLSNSKHREALRQLAEQEGC